MKRTVASFFQVVFLVFAALAAHAEGINLLRNADFAQGQQNWNLQLSNGNTALVEKTEGAVFARALVMVTSQTAKQAATLQQPINAAFRQGEKITLKLWLKGSAGASVTGSVGGNNETQPRVVQAPFILSSQWQEFSAVGTCPRDFKAEELILNLKFPVSFNTVHVGAIRLFKGEESNVTIVSTPAVQPAPKAQVTFQIVGPANPHLPPSGGSSGDGSFDISSLDPPSAPSPKPSPLEVPLPKPQTPVTKPPINPTPAVIQPVQPAKPKPAGAPSLLNLSVAPRPGATNYATSPIPQGFQKISPFQHWLGEAMPEDACGILHNSDFAHNKTLGGTVTGSKLLGGWTLPDKPSIKSEFVSAKVGGYTTALRLTSTPDAAERAEPFMLRLLQVTKTPPVTSDDIFLRVWLRSPDNACLSLRVDQHAQNVCHTAISADLNLTPDWKEYTFRGRRSQGTTYQELWTYFYTGACPGTIEITGVCLTTEGATSVR